VGVLGCEVAGEVLAIVEGSIGCCVVIKWGDEKGAVAQ
jgi:hypothetical protein